MEAVEVVLQPALRVSGVEIYLANICSARRFLIFLIVFVFEPFVHLGRIDRIIKRWGRCLDIACFLRILENSTACNGWLMLGNLPMAVRFGVLHSSPSLSMGRWCPYTFSRLAYSQS
jgi:hypothetical protein